jgi:hypothetical protein
MADASPLDAARGIVMAARAGGSAVRLLGGIGVALRCSSAREHGAFARQYSDLDLVTTRHSGLALSRTLEKRGYVPEHRFNAMHGHSRMMFTSDGGLHVDVFIERFAMCHQLDLSTRLTVHDTTISLADLLLTKLQIAELNEKDVTDAAALLLDHDLSSDEDGINVEYMTSLLSRDWGWWRTVTDNLAALSQHLPGLAPGEATGRVDLRVRRLLDAIASAPKGLRWKARAKAGDRIPWRDEPEESH